MSDIGTLYEISEQITLLKNENARLRVLVERIKGPLAELIIAYQDADSPAIQDTLRRGRSALSSDERA